MRREVYYLEAPRRALQATVMTTTEDKPIFVTPEALADRIGIKARAIRRAIAAGEIKAFRLRPRGPWRIKAAEAERVLLQMGITESP